MRRQVRPHVRERERERGREREGVREGERDLLRAAGSYMAIEARSSSCADVATRNKSLRCVRERQRGREKAGLIN